MSCKHNWDWLGETRESTYEWCPECGAIKRTREEGVKIFRPKSAKKAKGK